MFRTLRCFTSMLWVCCGLSASACQGSESAATEVVVVIDAHAELRASLSRLALQGERGSAEIWLRDAPSGVELERFPLSLSLSPRQEDQEVGRLEIAGYAGGELEIERSIQVAFVAGQRRVLHLFLHPNCTRAAARCESDQTCDDCGECVAPELLTTAPLRGDPLTDGLVHCSDGADGNDAEGDPGDGSDQDGSGEDGSAGADGDGAIEPVGTLTLAGPALAATGSCHALTLTRSGAATQSAAVSIEGLAGGALFADATCATALASPTFVAGAASLTVYVAPALPASSQHAQLELVAEAGESASPALTIDVRRRAVGVAAGSRFSLVQLEDGSIVSMGSAESLNLGFDPADTALTYATPQRAPLLDALELTGLRTEAGTSCGLHDGGLYCWGSGDYGQFGRGDYTYLSVSPLEVTNFPSAGDGHPVTSFDPGHKQVCAIKAGLVFCWGYNNRHQVSPSADGTLTSPYKVQLPLPPNVTYVQVAAGEGFSCALDSLGVVRCWGNDDATPKALSLPGARKVTRIAAAGIAACMLDEQGSVYCVADNFFGHLGHSGESSWLPTKVTLPEPVVDVVVGGTAVCARSETSVYCWGRADGDRLGTGATQAKAPPAKVKLPVGAVTGLSVGETDSDHVLAIVDGLVYGWGLHAHGQLGTHELVGDLLSPTESTVLGDRTPKALRLFGWGNPIMTSVSCALSQAGGLECWGFGGDGELGNGSDWGNEGSYRITPGPVTGMSTGVTDVDIGGGFVMAIKGGRVYGWGNDYTGSGTGGSITPVLIPGLPSSGATRVDAGDSAACATFPSVAEPGVYCWGNEQAALALQGITEPGVFAPPTRVLEGAATAVALSKRSGCAVRDGGVWCWGDFAGSTTPVAVDGLPEATGTQAITEVALAQQLGCALRADGELYCFAPGGPADSLGDGYTGLRAGQSHFCATRDDEKGLYCWGDNFTGQLGQGDRDARAVPTPVPGIVPPVSLFEAGGLTRGVTCAQDAEAFKCWGNNASRPMGHVPFVTQPTVLLPWP